MSRIILAALLAVILLPSGAHAGDGAVAVPIGDWIAQASGAIASIAVAVVSWIAAKWLPA